MQQAEAIAELAIGGAPIVKGEELEVRHADCLLDPRADAICIASPSAIVRGFPSASWPSPGICHLASRSLATRDVAFGSGVTKVASARI